MPKPKQDEPKEDFLRRYMGDAEAVRSFPDEKQRYAVALSLYEHRNTLEEAMNAASFHGERDGAEPFPGRHLQPGIVGYPEMKHPISGKQGIDVLIEKDTIDAMRASAKGQPVVNWAHDMSSGSEKWIKDGKAVGVLTRSYWNGEDGWEHCDFFVWDKEAKANCRNGFRLSNAWKGDEIDWTPGVHNGKPYDGRLIAAHYTHLAIVPNPRYEGAVIYANSKGGVTNMIMKLLGLGKPEGVALEKEHPVQIGDKKYTALEVVNALAAADAAKATLTVPNPAAIKADDSVEVNGKKYSGLEVANALAAIEKTQAEKKEVLPPAAAAEKKIELTETEFANAVDARVSAALEKAVGDGFFNGIAKLAQTRPTAGGETAAAAVGTHSEKARLARGKHRWGSKGKPVAA